MKIPLFKPFTDYNEYNNVLDTIKGGWVNEGETTKIFENMVAEKCGRSYGVAVSSGTVAIMIATRLRSVYRSHLTDYVFIAPFNAVRNAEKDVELEDIDKETLNVKEHSEVGTNLLVHFNNRKITKLISNCHYIHDISHCIGTDFSDIKGDLCISFSAQKNITTGQGGMVLTNDKYFAQQVQRFKNHGRINNADDCKGFGGNYKYNDILASMGIAQMHKLGEILDNKRRIVNEYRKYLGNRINAPDTPWVIIYETSRAKELVECLTELDVCAAQLYKPLHKLVGYTGLRFPNAEWAYNNLVYLPGYVDLADEDIKYICDKITDFEGR